MTEQRAFGLVTRPQEERGCISARVRRESRGAMSRTPAAEAKTGAPAQFERRPLMGIRRRSLEAFLAVAICCVSAVLWGSPSARGDEREMGRMKNETADTLDRGPEANLDRPPGEYEVSRAPAQGQHLKQNPPVFVWLPVKGVHDYVLQYSQDPEFRDDSTVTVEKKWDDRTVTIPVCGEGDVTFSYSVRPTTIHVLHHTLPAGKWYWRYGYDAGKPAGMVFGKVREFYIEPDAVEMPFPEMKDVIARIGRDHPRLLIDRDELARIRELAGSDLKEEADRLRRECDDLIGEDLVPEPDFLPQPAYSAEWNEAYGKDYRTIRPIMWGMEDCAEAYLITGDRKYGLEAKRRLMHLISWDPNGSTSLGHNDEIGSWLPGYCARVYDYIYDLLTEQEREQCRKVLAVRMNQLYLGLRVLPFELKPFDSHAMDYYLGFLTEACVALAGEVDVDEWLEYCLEMLWAPFYPPYGGQDGGWSEGPSYWQWSTERFLRTFALAAQATGIPVQQRDWVRKTGYYKLYDNPPYSKMSPFGDGQEDPAGGGETMWKLAQLLRDPYLEWFADELGFKPHGLEAFLAYGKEVKGKAPIDLPQGRCFWDVGLACMHSDLAHGERNVHFMLRSSPFGSISHSYADQNAFILHAFGEPLAIASGYYTSYGVGHHRYWTWQTKAANCIGVDGEGQEIRDWNAKGRIVEFESDDYCHYAMGDAHAAYGGRLTKFDRRVLYIRPLDEEMDPVIVIYDDLASPKQSTYQWWLHALEEMRVEADTQTVHISRGKARLDVFFLAPAGLKFSQTDQFSVPPEPDEGKHPNQWHLTAETTKPADTCRFLTVLLPYRSEEDGRKQEVRLLSGRGYLGAEVKVQGKRHVVVFRTEKGNEPLRVDGLDVEGEVSAASWSLDGTRLGGISLKGNNGSTGGQK